MKNYLLSLYVTLSNGLFVKMKEKDGGETLQNAIWILVGLAIALIVGWVFFKPTIEGFVKNLWNTISTWANTNVKVQ